MHTYSQALYSFYKYLLLNFPGLCCPVLRPLGAIHLVIFADSDLECFNLDDFHPISYTEILHSFIRVQTERFPQPVGIFWMHNGTDPYKVAPLFWKFTVSVESKLSTLESTQFKINSYMFVFCQGARVKLRSVWKYVSVK